MLAALLALTTFASAFCSDFVETRYVQAVGEHAPHRAARLSVVMYAVGFVGWAITVKVSLWYCLPEVLGLYLGTFLAARRPLRATSAGPTL